MTNKTKHIPPTHNMLGSMVYVGLVPASAFLSVDKYAARKPNRYILSNVVAICSETKLQHERIDNN